MCIAVSAPESRHFQTVFNQLAADAKVPGNFKRSLTVQHKLPQSSIWHQRGSASRIGCFFIDLAVIPGNGSTAMILRLDIQAAGLVAEENVRDFFHQSSVSAHRRMRRIKNDYAAPIGQRPRSGATRPCICSLAQQVLSRLLAQAFDLFKVEHEEIRKPG